MLIWVGGCPLAVILGAFTFRAAKTCILVSIYFFLSFYADFGPLNLAMVYRYCCKINKKLKVNLLTQGLTEVIRFKTGKSASSSYKTKPFETRCAEHSGERSQVQDKPVLDSKILSLENRKSLPRHQLPTELCFRML